MTINSILLHAAAENCEPHRGPANYAVQLARAFDAHLTALIFELDVALPRGAYGKRFVAEITQEIPDGENTGLSLSDRNLAADVNERTE